MMPEVRFTMSAETHARLKDAVSKFKPKTSMGNYIEWAIEQQLDSEVVTRPQPSGPVHRAVSRELREPEVVYDRKLCDVCENIVKPMADGSWRCCYEGGCGSRGNDYLQLRDISLTELPDGVK